MSGAGADAKRRAVRLPWSRMPQAQEQSTAGGGIDLNLIVIIHVNKSTDK
jgi:hypothetical protein